jgi:hypothetical protein
LFLLCSHIGALSKGAPVDRQLAHLKQNIARIRRDIRLQAGEIEQLIAADIDCTTAALRLMRMQADLVLFVEKRERLLSGQAA